MIIILTTAIVALSLILIVYMIVTNGIKITITKNTTHEEIIKEEPKVEYMPKTLEELKEDETLAVYEDAMAGVLTEMNEALGVGEDK